MGSDGEGKPSFCSRRLTEVFLPTTFLSGGRLAGPKETVDRLFLKAQQGSYAPGPGRSATFAAVGKATPKVLPPLRRLLSSMARRSYAPGPGSPPERRLASFAWSFRSGFHNSGGTSFPQSCSAMMGFKHFWSSFWNRSRSFASRNSRVTLAPSDRRGAGSRLRAKSPRPRASGSGTVRRRFR